MIGGDLGEAPRRRSGYGLDVAGNFIAGGPAVGGCRHLRGDDQLGRELLCQGWPAGDDLNETDRAGGPARRSMMSVGGEREMA